MPRPFSFLTPFHRRTCHSALVVKPCSRFRFLATSSKPPTDENGLYFGQFTKQEYDEAAEHVRSQLQRLENDVMGDENVRSNMDRMPLFPQRDPHGPNAASAANIKNLSQLFAQTIKTTGPMSLSAYMRQCLTHPEFGYYTTRDPLVKDTGDFITSPEISSVFGEMIGIWLFTVWDLQGRPPHIRMLEFGPGRGTLIHDCLKTFNKLCKRSFVKIEVNLVEASPVLRKQQWKLLCTNNGIGGANFNSDENGFNISTTKWNNPIRWLDTEKDVLHLDSAVPNYVIAHEFFDALPIKGFQRTDHGWRELLVEHTPSVVNTQPKLEASTASEVTSKHSSNDNPLLETEFHLTVSNKETPSSMIPKFSKRFENLPVGSRIEICTDAELFILKMAALLNNEMGLGAVLVIDYGVVGAIPENSLRGIYQHKFVSPFIKPGDVDLSVDVDFDNLVRVTENYATSFGPVDQGDWLHNAGIGHRVDQLLKHNEAHPDRQDLIYDLYRRLTDKDDKGMGKIYKFLCLMPKGSKKPLGFV